MPDTIAPYKFTLIQKSKVKALALRLSETRARKFTRVSEEFLIGCEHALRVHMERHIHSMPSVGKTIR